MLFVLLWAANEATLTAVPQIDLLPAIEESLA